MPIDSPAGPITTLEDAVAAARADGVEKLTQRYTQPVFLIQAPVQVWSEVTEVHAFGAPKRMLPSMVVELIPGKLNKDPDKLSVGRAGVCDVILPFGAMSKVHGNLSRTPKGYEYQDAGSTNGTILSAAKLKPGSPVLLRDKDTLKFGDVTAQFLLPASLLAEIKKRAG